jgi:uncharacterized cupredoxin-like copper-binding protein
MHHARIRVLSLFAVVAVALGAASCGGGGKTVDVTLREFEVAPAQSSIGAGEVTFKATNNGPDDNHELVVIKTDLDPGGLPTDENGAVDESGAGIEVIGEIEEFAPGTSEEAKFTLTAGKYVLICNVFDEEEQEAHYAQGMRAAFTVTG